MEKISKEDGFLLDAQSEIVLYGASYIGKVTGAALLERGISVVAFIDQRASEIKECLDLPVYTIDEAKAILSSDVIVYVAVKNVFYHEEIALNLRAAGFQKIIYKTKEAIDQSFTKDGICLDEIYESIYKKGHLFICQCPYISADGKEMDFKNYVLKEEDQDVIILSPVALLYSGVTDWQWSDIPVLALVPYYEMFQGIFDGDDEKIQPYLQLAKKGAQEENIGISKAWEKSVIQGRADVMKQMDYFYYTQRSFFINNAPKVSWNEKGYFNLKTGKHRATYLVMRGEQCIPVRISKSEWEQAQKVSDFNVNSNSLMKKHRIPLLFNLSKDINHNCFSENLFLKDIFMSFYYKDLLKGKQGIANLEIIDQSGTAGYFYRFFSKMGVESKIVFQSEEEGQIFRILTENEDLSEHVQEGKMKIIIKKIDQKYVVQM